MHVARKCAPEVHVKHRVLYPCLLWVHSIQLYKHHCRSLIPCFTWCMHDSWLKYILWFFFLSLMMLLVLLYKSNSCICMEATKLPDIHEQKWYTKYIRVRIRLYCYSINYKNQIDVKQIWRTTFIVGEG